MLSVKACPICGHEYMAHCYHDGEEVSSVEMPLEKAIALAMNSLTMARGEVKEWDELCERYTKLLEKARQP